MKKVLLGLVVATALIFSVTTLVSHNEAKTPATSVATIFPPGTGTTTTTA